MLHCILSGLLMIRNPSPPVREAVMILNHMQENFVTDQIIVDKKVPFSEPSLQNVANQMLMLIDMRWAKVRYPLQ